MAMKLIVFLCYVYIIGAHRLFVRDNAPEGWTKLSRAPAESIIKFRIALRQYNLDTLEAKVLAKSDPSSPEYGKHLSSREVLDIIAPPRSEVLPVLAWLKESDASKIEWLGDVIKAEASVEQVETMFQTKMFVYQHRNGKQRVLNYGAAYIPDSLHSSIDLVSGLTEFPFFKTVRKSPIRVGTNTTDPGIIIPPTIQTLYNLPTKFAVHPNSSVCVAEFQNDDSFNDTDLVEFAQMTGVPTFNKPHIVGPYNGLNPDAESTLDVQYGGATALNTTLWFWTVEGWMFEFATDLFNAQQVPWIVSMSWGWPEPQQCQDGVGNCSLGWTSEQYVARVNTEYMKIVARGITLVAASGDQGAPGDLNPMCTNVGKDALSNLFPASSPWVTAVGATMLTTSQSKIQFNMPPICKQIPCAQNGSEVVCSIPEALITTGGGFSSYSSVPSWQADIVNNYLQSGVSLPNKKYFNASNRAYPDVSALGHNYIIQWGGTPIQVDGTSCSSPVFAGIMALINSARFNAKKSAVGFINPALYMAANISGIFNDFSTGSNKCTENCCSTIGFDATHGWDPVTGLGSPVFPALLKYFMGLP